MISDAIALYDLIRKIKHRHEVLSALFSWDGTRLKGDPRVVVKVRIGGVSEQDLWWYEVEPVNDFLFLRFPVNPGSVVESAGRDPNEPTSDTKYFRYVSGPSGAVQGHPLSNVRVNFMVFGYKPDDLLAIGEESNVAVGA
jgi:hypothetical protein